MHDLKYIRENPTDFDAAMKRRGLEAQSPSILSMDEKRRAAQTKLQDIQAARNEKSKMIGKIKSQGGDAQAVMDEVSAMKEEMAALEEQERTLSDELNTVLAGLPNMMASDVPDGDDEDENVEVRKVGEVKVTSGPDHVDIGEKLGQIDFETAAKMSGARFVMLQGGMARMERALAQFFLDTHTGEHGYTEVVPPERLIMRPFLTMPTAVMDKVSGPSVATVSPPASFTLKAC